MKIYVVRHGRTDSNDKKIFNGRYDEDINQTGINQAIIARDKLANYDIDLIISSPMKRTLHTAQIINTKNINLILDEHFIERDMGELTLKNVKDKDRKEYWKYNKSKYKGLESISEVQKRVFEGLDNIKNKYNDKNILIVTHGAVTQMIKVYCENIQIDDNISKVKSQENCEIKEYEL